MLHDHKEKAFTTDGMHPGGSVTAIVDRSYLDERGWPKTQGVDWTPFFTSQYYKREIPVWAMYDKEGMLGEAGARAPRWARTVLLGLIIGALLGCGFAFGRAFGKRK
jgi:hypothetical protein